MDAVSVYEERRRIQNLVAQRKWRQKSRARQRSTSQKVHSSDNHLCQPSSAPVYQATTHHLPRNHSQPTISIENRLPIDGARLQEPIALFGDQNNASALMKGGDLPETVVPSSPFDSDDLPGTSISERDLLSKGHMDNGLVLGSNQIMDHDYHLWQIPDCVTGQSAYFRCCPTQNALNTHIGGTGSQITPDMIKNQIIGCIEKAEGLYEYGAMMQLFPLNNFFQKQLADVKRQILSTSMGY